MRSGICVKCQGVDVHRLPLRQFADTGLPLTGFRRADVTVLVCTGCGYAETYVDADSLERVRKRGQRVVPLREPPGKNGWEA